MRIRYLLPREIVADELSGVFPELLLDVQAFSQLVAGAKDHLTLTQGQTLRAAGVIGGAELVVTFGKPSGDRPCEQIAAFEAALEAEYGLLVYPKGPKSGPAA